MGGGRMTAAGAAACDQTGDVWRVEGGECLALSVRRSWPDRGA